VNGLRYAKDVVVSTLRSVAHRSGLLYQKRFDPAPDDNAHYDLKLGYASSHTYALAAVAAGTSVLDIGSGPGGIADELANKGCHVTVVDRYLPRVEHPRVEMIQQDLDAPLRFDVRPFDYLLLLDVIEHLRDPEGFVAQLRRQFDYHTKKVILTTPNVAFIVQRMMLLLGQFNYGKAGILDRTHTRLFTFRAHQAPLAR